MAQSLESWLADLPVGAALPRLGAALATPGAAVLQAPPGAGKTTLVPLVLLDAPWLTGQRILLLEPRRVAARAAARRMAAMRGEAVGETIGYRTRLDSRVGPRTRIEVVTEGILVRMLQDDPTLEGTGLVIFDEFHERSLDADLGLALTLDARRQLRPELRLLVMSATLDGASVARLIGDVPVISSSGQSHPVGLRYLGRPPAERLAQAVASAIRQAIAAEPGSVLVFLPGGAEIHRVERLLAADPPEAAAAVVPLYGDLPQAAQDAALAPPHPGERKIVLATAIAETSLTIEGIRTVVDSGLMRVPRFEPRSGMTRLETVRVSQASAEQRRGRAGRLAPGMCYRLWAEAEQAHLLPFTPPEIYAADLAPLALTLASWGCEDPATLPWLDAPPDAAYAEARALLHRLAALDGRGRITPHGRAMEALRLHPRLAHMMLRGKDWGVGRLAGAIAALLSERDLVKAAPGDRDADLRLRVDLVRGDGAGAPPAGLTIDRGALARVRDGMRQAARQLGGAGEDAWGAGADVGRLVAQAYPDRIGQRRPASRGQFLLANGRGAALPPADALAAQEFVAVSDVDGDRRAARIFLAAPLDRAAIERDFAASIESAELVAWDARAGAVLARRRRQLGALVLSDEPLIQPPPERVVAALLDGIRSLGIAALPWRDDAVNLRQRIAFLGRLDGVDAGWPEVSDAALLATLDTWLAPSLAGVTRRAHLDSIALAPALARLLRPEQRDRLQRLAPSHLTVPSGSRLAVDYAGDAPVLAVRLQEIFGVTATPTVAAGRVPVVLHLLSPAGRPLQVTRDLGAFWTGSYPEVRRAMRGRYPKHAWPEDPRTAPATARRKRPARSP